MNENSKNSPASKPEVAIIIPARLHSSRLPRKLLLDSTGKPLIIHTYENALQSKLADSVTIATDSHEIANACSPYSANVCLFYGDFRNGTQRVAATVPKLAKQPDIIVNLQGDSVGVTGEHLDKLITNLIDSPYNSPLTLVAPFHGLDLFNANNVKVAVENGFCHWFSRWPLHGSKLHIGVYAFRRETLESIRKTKESFLGVAEKLEQLDWLVGGYKIAAVEIDDQPISINTLDDYRRFVELQKND